MRFFKVSASMGEFVIVEAGTDITFLNVSHSSNNFRQRNNIHTLYYKLDRDLQSCLWSIL